MWHCKLCLECWWCMWYIELVAETTSFIVSSVTCALVFKWKIHIRYCWKQISFHLFYKQRELLHLCFWQRGLFLLLIRPCDVWCYVSSFCWPVCSLVRHGVSVGNTVEEKSSVFYIIWMLWLPPARACWQLNFASTKSSSSGWPV